MTKFIPSPMQSQFFDFIQHGRGSAVIKAVAGSGKTTSCVESLAYVPAGATVQMLAFNATIAKELSERLGAKGYDTRRFSAKTFHGLGFGAVRKYLEGRGVRVGKPDSGKCRTLLREWLGDKSEDYLAYGDFACRLVGLAKGEGIGALVTDSLDAWRALVDHHDLQLDTEGATEERGIEIARALLARSNEAALRGVIDFDDMLYCVVLWKLRLWQNDFVYVDECQDTNPVRRALARSALKTTGRLIAVGDEKQAIYGFTGASHDAVDLIKRDFRAVELPLTVSYRCARAVVAQAKEIVPYIESHETAPEGKVETLDLNAALGVLGPHDAVLCRQVAPLIKLAYTLIARGIGCKVLGKEIGEGLTSLVKKMKARGLPQLLTKLETFRDREVAKFTAKGDERKAEAVHDRVDCVLTVIDSLSENDRTVPALLEAIDTLFSDTNGCLLLSSVHKAKGREWQRVAILRPDLMPSKRARQDWEYQQEQNLLYVAYTRAKEHLIFLKS